MLSRIEREYLKGNKKLNSSYRYNLRTKIRKKVRQAIKDLTLVFKTWDATELRFYKEDYFKLCVPLVRAIQGVELRERFSEYIECSYLALTLEGAGKRYDYKRLATNEKYKQRMIDWLVKNRIEWKLPDTEERKRRFKKLKRMMGEAEVEEKTL